MTVVRSTLAGIVIGILSLALVGTVSGQTTPYEFASQSTIKVSGTSTVHDWTCAATEFSGQVQVDPDAGLASISGGDLTIPVEQIDCERGGMNGKTHNALKVDDYPTIRFELGSVKAVRDSADWTILDARGDLTVAGQTQEINFSARGQSQGAALQVAGDVALRMTDFGVDPPTALFGAIKADDKVTVTFDVSLERRSTPQASSQ